MFNCTHRASNATTSPTESPTSPFSTDLAFILTSAIIALAVVIIILVSIIVLVRSAILDKRNTRRRNIDLAAERAQATRRVLQQEPRRYRGIIDTPVKPDFNWHHSIRVDGTLPPSYAEAEKLPSLDNNIPKRHKTKDDPKRPLLDEGDDIHRSHEMSATTYHPQTTDYGTTNLTNTL